MFRQVFSRACAQIKTANKPRFFSTPNKIEPESLEKTINQVTLLGRVGQDPQKRGTEDHPLVIFSLATHSNYKYENGDVLQRTEWHRICVFKPYLRESTYKYMKKGQRVLVTGRLNYSEIKDDEGKPRTATNIIADDVIFFSSPTST